MAMSERNREGREKRWVRAYTPRSDAVCLMEVGSLEYVHVTPEDFVPLPVVGKHGAMDCYEVANVDYYV